MSLTIENPDVVIPVAFVILIAPAVFFCLQCRRQRQLRREQAAITAGLLAAAGTGVIISNGLVFADQTRVAIPDGDAVTVLPPPRRTALGADLGLPVQYATDGDGDDDGKYPPWLEVGEDGPSYMDNSNPTTARRAVDSKQRAPHSRQTSFQPSNHSSQHRRQYSGQPSRTRSADLTSPTIGVSPLPFAVAPDPQEDAQ
eukprot:GILI01025930.1.p1 GENE.GILI01025930.1~~GILI01025930.1.p1  ORF type:complete len:225 (+),score=19.64 GILI01025930.1:79-675(+)